MKVTYISHSGFMIEFENKALLFDYYEGEIPEIDSDKRLYVFVSHKHGDHYNRNVLELQKKRGNVVYIFSGDILSEKKARENGIIRVLANNEFRIDDMTICTLKSNDEGVSFIVNTNGKTVYHAGDLNWWHWEGEPDEDNLFMEHSYKQEIAKIKGKRFDAAFIVLDPRQEEQFCWGFDWFMRNTDTICAVPMHMWNKYSWIDRLKELPLTENYRDRICAYNKKGEIIYL